MWCNDLALILLILSDHQDQTRFFANRLLPFPLPPHAIATSYQRSTLQRHTTPQHPYHFRAKRSIANAIQLWKIHKKRS
jgi:hypothetical protein